MLEQVDIVGDRVPARRGRPAVAGLRAPLVGPVGSGRPGVGTVLGLQRLAGNAATCRVVQRGAPAVQRVAEKSIRGTLPPKADIDTARRRAKGGGLIVVRRNGQVWAVDATASVGLTGLVPGQTYVTAFVQPFDDQRRDELWLFATAKDGDKFGAWGNAIGSHSAGQDFPAMAAGEAKWSVTKDGSRYEVTLIAVNQQTSVYGLGLGDKPSPRGPAQDPRATQSDLLADYQCLIFRGLQEFQDSAYYKGARWADVHDPADLKAGFFMVVAENLSKKKEQTLLGRGITPQREQITYRPTPEDRELDTGRRMSIPDSSWSSWSSWSGPDAPRPAQTPGPSGPSGGGMETSTTSTSVTSAAVTEAVAAPPPTAETTTPAETTTTATPAVDTAVNPPPTAETSMTESAETAQTPTGTMPEATMPAATVDAADQGRSKHRDLDDEDQANKRHKRGG